MTRRAKVFIINEPLRRNPDTGEYEKFLPMESASGFGEVVKVTPDGSPGANPEGWMATIRSKLEAEWEDGDFLVLVGDQGLLAYAASVIGEYIGERLAATEGASAPTLRLLKWERRASAYTPLVLREPAPT